MCSAPTNATVLGFRFFRDGQNTGSPLGNGSAQLPLLRMEIEDAGSYTCDFWGPEAVQEIPLEQSAPVQIILIGKLWYLLGGVCKEITDQWLT